MKLVIATALVPFVDDEVRRLGVALKAAAVAAGHAVEIVGFPFRPDDRAHTLRTIVATRQFRLDEADAVVALAFPATLIAHRRMTLWLAGDAADAGADPEAETALAAAEAEAASAAVAVFRAGAALPDTFGGREAPLIEPPVDTDASSAAWAVTVERLLP